MGLSPASAEEMIALEWAISSQKSAYWRQVGTYFEMAAAVFVLWDALDPELFSRHDQSRLGSRSYRSCRG